jgi:hypothetical protein
LCRCSQGSGVVGVVSTVGVVNAVNAVGVVSAVSAVGVVNAVSTVGVINAVNAVSTVGIVSAVNAVNAVSTVGVVRVVLDPYPVWFAVSYCCCFLLLAPNYYQVWRIAQDPGGEVAGYIKSHSNLTQASRMHVRRNQPRLIAVCPSPY